MSRTMTLNVEGHAAVGLDRSRSVQFPVVGVAVALLVAGTAWLATEYGIRNASLFLVGAGFGLVLYQAAFGFTTHFRRLVTAGDGRGLRAQMLMLSVATLLFAPLLASGTVLGDAVGGAVAPASVSVLVGAFIFAIGMQMGGG